MSPQLSAWLPHVHSRRFRQILITCLLACSVSAALLGSVMVMRWRAEAAQRKDTGVVLTQASQQRGVTHAPLVGGGIVSVGPAARLAENARTHRSRRARPTRSRGLAANPNGPQLASPLNVHRYHPAPADPADHA